MTTAAEECALVPKLRFPEFQEARGWESKSLIDVCLRITNGKANAEDHEEDGIYPLYDRSEVIKRSCRFAYDDEAVIIPGEGIRFHPKYCKGKFNLHQRAYALMQHQCDARFIYYSMDHFQGILAEKAVKSTVLSLRLPILEQFRLPITNKDEQHKIADCLASIDELITLESQKLDTLKRHKKGLMQQLFPAEGETVPRLRFQEFRDAGEWGTKLLGSIGQTINGLSGKSGDDFGQGKPFITYKQVFDSAFVDFAKCGLVEIREGENQNEIKRGDILFTTSSETPDEVGYASVVLREPPCPVYLNSFCFSFRPSSPNDLIPEFSGYLFRSPIYRKLVTILAQGSTRFNISKVAFLNLSLPIPQTEEQQKIADCLTSFDDRIAAQNQKIDALKAHKKGLMQQLFPAPDGFSAAQAGKT